MNDNAELEEEDIQLLKDQLQHHQDLVADHQQRNEENIARIEALEVRVNTQIPALKQVVAEREARIATLEEENARLRDACIVANDFLVEGSSAQEFVRAALNPKSKGGDDEG